MQIAGEKFGRYMVNGQDEKLERKEKQTKSISKVCLPMFGLKWLVPLVSWQGRDDRKKVPQGGLLSCLFSAAQSQ